MHVVQRFERLLNEHRRHNRSIFLNELDGFGDNDGVFVLAFSNHPERIDEALLKRPSRFNRVFHPGLSAFEERKEYLTGLLSAPPLYRRFPSGRETEGAADRLAEGSEGLAPAHIKEAVLSAALGLTKDAEDGGREDSTAKMCLHFRSRNSWSGRGNSGNLPLGILHKK